MSLVSFFGSLANGIYNGLGWFYSNTVGAFLNDFQGYALSSAESFVLKIVAAGLSAFGFIVNSFVSLVVDLTNWTASLAMALGVFGPPIAVILIVGIIGLVLVTIRIVVDLL